MLRSPILFKDAVPCNINQHLLVEVADKYRRGWTPLSIAGTTHLSLKTIRKIITKNKIQREKRW